MVTVAFSSHFEKTIMKIKDALLKERVKAQIVRIVHDPVTEKTHAMVPEKHTGSIYSPIQAFVLL